MGTRVARVAELHPRSAGGLSAYLALSVAGLVLYVWLLPRQSGGWWWGDLVLAVLFAWLAGWQCCELVEVVFRPVHRTSMVGGARFGVHYRCSCGVSGFAVNAEAAQMVLDAHLRRGGAR